MSASDIGDGARKDLKTTQIAWIKKRNTCLDIDCISKAYLSRIDAVCDYPVISGIHPICTSAEEINADFTTQNQPTTSQTPSSQGTKRQDSNPQPMQATGRTGGNQTVENAAKRNATKIAALGFSKFELQSMIYTQNDLVNPYQKFITLEGLLGLLFDLPRLSKITVIATEKNKGFLLKLAGSPSGGFLFSFEDGDAFLSHVVNGDVATRLETTRDIHAASLTLLQIAVSAARQ